MRIGRVQLRNVKRHSVLDLELAPGLTVIRGANEAGKSTIQRALEMVLFRRATSTAQELDGLRTWGAQTEPWVGITFEDEGHRGALSKSFAGNRGTAEMKLDTGEVINDPAVIDQHVVGLTGLPSERFFRATASVHHHELIGLSQDEATLRDRLQQSISGADRGTYASRRKLDEAIRRYRANGSKNPGYLKVWRAEVERLGDSVARGEAALVTLEQDRAALAEARRQREDLDRQLAEQRSGRDQSARAVALLERGADAAQRYTTYKRATELRGEIAELEASHPSLLPLSALRGGVERLRNHEYRLSEMRAELAAEQDVVAQRIAVTTPNWRPWAFLSILLIAAAVAAAVAGEMLQASSIGLVAAAVLAVLGVGALLMTWLQRRRLAAARDQNQLREADIARRLTGRTALGDQARRVEVDRTAALTSLGLPDLAAAEAMLAAETDHTARIDNLKAEYRGLLPDGQPTDDVEQLRDQAAAEADECRHALAGMGQIGAEPEQSLAAYEAAVARLEPEREAQMQTEAHADARVTANDTDAELVAAESESLQAAQEQLAAAERRLRIYDETLAALNSAEQATMKKAARFLEERMSADIERITGGRYRRLNVDEATLTFSVHSPEMGDWVDARNLSQGTLDQLYLCARLGIIRQITQPATPPLIFDDPFVTFDDERARRALELLRDIATDHQVIFLTTSDRYDDLADRVIELPTPDQLDTPPATAPDDIAQAAGSGATGAAPAGQQRLQL